MGDRERRAYHHHHHQHYGQQQQPPPPYYAYDANGAQLWLPNMYNYAQQQNSAYARRAVAQVAPSQVESVRATKSAARERREKENTEFEQLGCMLPLPSAITSQLDKTSVVRLTISHLHLNTLFPSVISNQLLAAHAKRSPAAAPELHEVSSHLMQTLDGFVFVLAPNYRIRYISETASVHVGMPQVDLLDNDILEHIHPEDHSHVRRALYFDRTLMSRLNTNIAGDEFEIDRQFCVRMRCVLAKRNAGLTDQGYKVIHCSGFTKFRQAADGQVFAVHLLAIAHTLPPTTATELRLTSHMFMFRADQALTLMFLDTGSSQLFSHELSELVDKSWYSLVHPEDVGIVKTAHDTVRRCHQSTSGLYRVLSAADGCGGHCWLFTQFLLIQLPQRSSRPQSLCILAVNTCLSEPGSPEACAGVRRTTDS